MIKYYFFAVGYMTSGDCVIFDDSGKIVRGTIVNIDMWADETGILIRYSIST